MKLWKEMLLGLYYFKSQKAREAEAIARTAAGTVPVCILFYHRIADNHPNGWTLGTKQFADQIRWLQDRFEIVSLKEGQKRVASGVNRCPSVVITFDDGYADNCKFALPLLNRERLPYTYFVTTGNMQSGQPFPHDVAAGTPLQPNTPEQIQKIFEAGAEIGAHTRTHADLGPLTERKQLEDEILGSQQDLESLLKHPITSFAFPFGLHNNMSSLAFQVAKEGGIATLCSAYGGYNFPGDDAFHLQRIHSDPEWIRFKNWLSIDPRKIESIERYKYSLGSVADKNSEDKRRSPLPVTYSFPAISLPNDEAIDNQTNDAAIL